MKPRKPLVVGNWKMHGDRLANERLLAGLRASIGAPVLAAVDVAVCPPFAYIGQAVAQLEGSGIGVGAQDVSAFENGAYTGEVSVSMLADLGCRWVIVGHSERRTLFGEDDATVAAKASRALAGGLSAIVCVGETLEQRERQRTEAVLAAQVEALADLAGSATPQNFVVAYEPVWAIGTGRSATPEQAQGAHEFIRARLAAVGFAESGATRILYGGSVKPSNAATLFSMPDIDGGLIGGASLSADDFAGIARAAANPGS